MSMMKRWLLAAAVVGAVALGGCGKKAAQQPGQPSGGAEITLNGAGASFPYPIYSAWISEYGQATPGVRINYQSIGSGGGIQALQQRTVDFGASDAPLSDAEEKTMPAPVVHIPTVAGAVVIAYNLPNLTQQLRLDGPTLARIYLGRIKTWNDPALAALNPGVSLPSTAIAVAHRSDGSGTTYLFTTYLSAISPDWKQSVGAGKAVNWPVGIGAKGNEGVSGVVKQTAGAIGYVELAYAQQNHLKYALMKNASGRFMAPTAASTAAAAASFASQLKKDVRSPIVNSTAPGAYPITGVTYFLVYKDLPDRRKGVALANFLLWAMDAGQKDAERLGYVPLPAELVAINKATIHSLTYQGKPLLAASGGASK